MALDIYRSSVPEPIDLARKIAEIETEECDREDGEGRRIALGLGLLFSAVAIPLGWIPALAVLSGVCSIGFGVVALESSKRRTRIKMELAKAEHRAERGEVFQPTSF